MNVKSSLKHKLILYTIIASTIISTIFTVLSLGVEYKLQAKNLNESISSIRKTSLRTIENALWNINKSHLSIQISDLLRIEGVEEVKLLDEDDSILFDKVKANKRDSSFFKNETQVFELFYEDEKTERTYIGALKVQYSNEAIFYSVLTRAFIVFATQASKTFFVTFLLVWLYERLVTKDLVRTSKVLEGMDVSQTEHQTLFTEKRKDRDEIYALQAQIESIYTNLVSKNVENERLLNIANDEKRQQEAKAMNASRLAALGEMAAGVAHEINNPLTIIKSCVFSLGRKKKKGIEITDAELLESFDKINTSIDRAAKIISNMKKVSRDGSDESVKELEVFSFMDETLSYFREKFQKNHVPFSVNVKPNVFIIGNEVELSQVITNLINNAYDAIKDSQEKWIAVSVTESDDSLFIKIRDSGLGIDSEIQDKIFNPFYTTKDVGKGTGLGLSIAKESMRKMGGDLTYNKESANTEFVIEVKKSAQEKAA